MICRYNAVPRRSWMTHFDWVAMVMKSMAKIRHMAIKMWGPIEFLDELAADTSELSAKNKKGTWTPSKGPTLKVKGH